MVVSYCQLYFSFSAAETVHIWHYILENVMKLDWCFVINRSDEKQQRNNTLILRIL